MADAPTDLAGRHILITSGPTRAPIDAVRYIANRSTGRLGTAIAREALARGAQVTFVAGPQSARPDPEGSDALDLVGIETVDELIGALEGRLTGLNQPDAVVHAMAVLDYVPAEPSADKTPSGRDEWTLALVRTPKVIRLIRQWAPEALLVQFKLEVGLDEEALKAAAMDSLRGNDANLVVANVLEQIAGREHPALIMDADGVVLARPQTKDGIAAALCDAIAARLATG